MKKLFLAAVALQVSYFASHASAITINFAEGITYPNDVPSSNAATIQDIDTYEESGVLFELSQIGTWSNFIGNYYGDNNAVTHVHHRDQFSGPYIVISKMDNTTFDLNQIDITSNTDDEGGGPASGREISVITAYDNNNIVIDSKILPPVDWGYSSGETVSLPSTFNNIAYASITTENAYCLGIDDVEILPPSTPIGMKGILLFRNIQEDRFQFKLTNVTDIAARAKKAVEDDLTLTFQFGTAADPIYTLSVISNDPNLDVGGNRMVWNDPGTGNLVRCIFSTEECVVSIKGDLDVYGEPVDNIIDGDMEVTLSVGEMNYTNTSYWNQYDSGSGPWTEGGNWSKFRNY